MTDYEVKVLRASENATGMTEGLCVDDVITGRRYFIGVHRVDLRPLTTRIDAGLVRFSKREHAPNQTGDILLRTPAYYRKMEDGDDLDGAQAANMAPMLADQFRESNIPFQESSFTAVGTLAASKEPWILCTSIRPRQSTGARALEARFSTKGTDAIVTTINSPDAFARQLGIDVARNAETKRAVTEDVLDLISRHLIRRALGADREVDAFVQVYHGPVHYHDATLTVQSSRQMAAAQAHRVWFTKRAKFSGECEYRFAVAAGYPVTDSLRLAMSPELSRLVAHWRLGDTWWSS